MKIFRDFWYLYFIVETEGKCKYFLNYNRASKYLETISKETSVSLTGMKLSIIKESFYFSLYVKP